MIHAWRHTATFPERPTIPGTTRVHRLSHFTPNSIVLSDGLEIATPNNTVVIYCTGYRLSYPFLQDIDTASPEDWPIDSIDHPLGVIERDRHIRPLGYRMFAIQPQYPINALTIMSSVDNAWAAHSGYAGGLLLGHSVLDPGVLDSKEKMGEDLVTWERYVRNRGIKPFESQSSYVFSS